MRIEKWFLKITMTSKQHANIFANCKTWNFFLDFCIVKIHFDRVPYWLGKLGKFLVSLYNFAIFHRNFITAHAKFISKIETHEINKTIDQISKKKKKKKKKNYRHTSDLIYEEKYRTLLKILKTAYMSSLTICALKIYLVLTIETHLVEIWDMENI